MQSLAMTTVTGFDLYSLPPRWLFLRIETADGIVGWGEPILEGRKATVESAVCELMETYVVGRDSDDIEDIWETLYRGGYYRGGPILMSALAGIDQALWDIKGKRYELPVYEFLGGSVRSKIRAYQWIGADDIDALRRQAKTAVEDGYTALKIFGVGRSEQVVSPEDIANSVGRVKTVREAVGDDIDVGVDIHGRTSRGVATVLLKELEEYDPMFVEEPLVPKHADLYPKLARETSVPIAVGERLYSRWDFKPHFRPDGVDIVQPDISHAGGISECKRIADSAATYDMGTVLTCSVGPIALAACLQICASTRTAFLQPANRHRNIDTYVTNSGALDVNDGYFDIPSGSGLGINVNIDKVEEKSSFSSTWNTPVWRHNDGSVSEW